MQDHLLILTHTYIAYTITQCLQRHRSSRHKKSCFFFTLHSDYQQHELVVPAFCWHHLLYTLCIICCTEYLLISCSANQLLNMPGKAKVPFFYCVVEVSKITVCCQQPAIADKRPLLKTRFTFQRSVFHVKSQPCLYLFLSFSNVCHLQSFLTSIEN